MDLDHLPRQAGAEIALRAVHHAEQGGDVVGQLGAAAVSGRVDVAEVVLEADSGHDGHHGRHNARQDCAIVVPAWIIGDQECAPIEEQPPRSGAPADDAERIRGMAVLGPRLRQIGGTSLHVRQRRQRRIPQRRRVEPPASFVRLAPPRRLDRLTRPLEHRVAARGDQILVEEGDRVVAAVALGADEPGRRLDAQPLGGQPLPHARVIGHLRERPGVGPSPSTPARPAVVGRLVRIVKADRSVADDEHQRREAIANADVLEDAAHDVRHLPDREADMRSDRWRSVLPVQLQTGSDGAGRVFLHAGPPGREPGEHHAQHQRDQRQPAERRHQQGAADGQPAPQVHVVAEEPGGAPLQAPRASRELIAVCLDFGDIVIGPDGHGTERPRVRVGCALVIHRHVEESRGATGLAGRLDFLQMAAERLLALVEAEDRLKCRRPGGRLRRMMRQRPVQAMANRSLECLVQGSRAPYSNIVIHYGRAYRNRAERRTKRSPLSPAGAILGARCQSLSGCRCESARCVARSARGATGCW